MSTVATKQQAMPGMALNETELMNVLRNSLYPGAQDDSIKLVIGYCKAAGLDPMQKPVHIVPMWDGKSKQMRDVIMPGIGSYRTQAARSGEYAGVSEPEFGPDVSEEVGGVKMTYPASCRVVVKRLLPNGSVAEFAATERWKENYATKSRDSAAPNAMWTRRPYAQLAKCAEAQALRKAFPEFGAQPTADEMEGKALDDSGTVYDGNTGEVLQRKEAPKALPNYADDQLEANIDTWSAAIQAGKKSADDIVAMISTRYQLNGEQIARIRSLNVTNSQEFEHDHA